jgi:hypothetical protein
VTARQTVAAALALTLGVLLVALAWHLILLGLAGMWAYRVLARRAGVWRPRPKSSWSSLGRTAAMLYAAWNSRWLKPNPPRNGRPLRVSVPRSAGVDDDGIPF